ncbi:SH3 domain-containing protein [Pseudomonas proteolytica]|uniref:SH3 domain-containing protein n=1 Tax=Pseudomonas proteolytica TaxID=219574 RepID=UPI003208B28A
MDDNDRDVKRKKLKGFVASDIVAGKSDVERLMLGQDFLSKLKIPGIDSLISDDFSRAIKQMDLSGLALGRAALKGSDLSRATDLAFSAVLPSVRATNEILKAQDLIRQTIPGSTLDFLKSVTNPIKPVSDLLGGYVSSIWADSALARASIDPTGGIGSFAAAAAASLGITGAMSASLAAASVMNQSDRGYDAALASIRERVSSATIGLESLSYRIPGIHYKDQIDALKRDFELATASPIFELFSSPDSLIKEQMISALSIADDPDYGWLVDDEEVVKALRSKDESTKVKAEASASLKIYLIRLYFLIELVNALMGFFENVEKLHQRFVGAQTPQEVRQVIRSGLGDVDKQSLGAIRIVNAHNVNLRTGPNQKTEIRATMPLATQVEVLGSDGKAWLHVVIEMDGDQIDGWMLRRYAQKIR